MTIILPRNQVSGLTGATHDAGIDLRGARNAALRQLVLDMPPAIAADTLGYAYTTTERHARNAGTTWAAYPAYPSTR